MIRQSLTILFLALTIQGCAVERIYRINTPKGVLAIHIANRELVEKEYYKQGGDGFKLNQRVFGFWNPDKMEIWSSDNTETLIHELRHFYEGKWHD